MRIKINRLLNIPLIPKKILVTILIAKAFFLVSYDDAQAGFCPNGSPIQINVTTNGGIEFWRGQRLIYRDVKDGVRLMGGKSGLDCADVYGNKNYISIRLGHQNDRVYMYGLKRNLDGDLIGIDRAYHQSIGTAIRFNPRDRVMLLQFGGSPWVWISFCWTTANHWTFANNPGHSRNQSTRGGDCRERVPAPGRYPYPFSHNLSLNVATPYSLESQILNVSYHPEAGLQNSTALSIVSEMNRLLSTNDGPGDVRCSARFELGYARSDSQLPASINSDRDLGVIFDKPGAIKVVSSINFCGNKSSPSIIGCAAEGYNRMVVEAMPVNRATLVWLHELAHSRGAGHRDGTDLLMNPSSTPTARKINQAECAAIGTVLQPPRPGLYSRIIVWTPIFDSEDLAARLQKLQQ